MWAQQVVVSLVRFVQDIVSLGDTINMASRMESSSKPGMIMMSASFYEQVRGMLDTLKTSYKVTCKKKSIKGKGSQLCYLVGRIGPQMN